MISLTTLIYGGLFLAAMLAVSGIAELLSARSQSKAVNRRMALRKEGIDSAEILRTLHSGNARGRAGLGPLEAALVAAGLTITVRRFVLMSLAGGLATALLLTGLLQPPLMAAAGALIAGLGVPYAILRFLRARRIQQFTDLLPEALDMLTRSLRAGHPTTAAFKLVGDQMPDPVGTEFGLVVDQMTYGLSLEEGLNRLRDRVPAPELNFLVTALVLQQASGGNLAEVLTALSKVMRDRQQMAMKVRALSAEGRLTAWLISGAPFIFFGLINLMAPEYYADVMDHPATMPVAIGTCTAIALATLIIFRMVRFRF